MTSRLASLPLLLTVRLSRNSNSSSLRNLSSLSSVYIYILHFSTSYLHGQGFWRYFFSLRCSFFFLLFFSTIFFLGEEFFGENIFTVVEHVHSRRTGFFCFFTINTNPVGYEGSSREIFYLMLFTLQTFLDFPNLPLPSSGLCDSCAPLTPLRCLPSSSAQHRRLLVELENVFGYMQMMGKFWQVNQKLNQLNICSKYQSLNRNSIRQIPHTFPIPSVGRRHNDTKQTVYNSNSLTLELDESRMHLNFKLSEYVIHV